MNRILITGGAGFIGSNLVRQLQEDYPNAQLLVIDDFRGGSFTNLSSEAGDGFSYNGEFIAQDLGGLDLYQIVEDFDPDTVFHLASITNTTCTDQAKMVADNLEPFEVLVTLAIERGYKLVWASSGTVYGTRANGATPERRPFRIEDAGRPANVYGFSKWLMENVHRRALADHAEMHCVGLRYFNVFGPGEAHKGPMASMVYQLAQQALAGRRPRIFRDGNQARDQVYVADVAAATIAAAADDARSGIYNVGFGKVTTFNQVVAAINEALGTQFEPDYIDNPYGSFYQDYTCADLTQTRKGLGWSPRHEPSEAMATYVRFLKAAGVRSTSP